jgi:enoyl-CoA hydratase/carnithine racemase
MAADQTLPDLPPTLAAHLDGAVAVLRLARPDKRNCIDNETVLGLETFFTRLPDQVGAVVIHGEGAHFSAGLDLSTLQETDAISGMMHSRVWHRVFQHIEFGRVPVFAALHGAVVGGGLELAAATHVRIAERSTFYALPEGQRGIFVGGGGAVRIPRLIGVARMMDMMLTGRTYGAAEGVTLGLSQYLVEDGEGLAKAIELAKRAAENAPMTNFALIHALPRIAAAEPGAGLLLESAIAAMAQDAPEAKQRLTDFLEKRAEKVKHEG